MVSVLLRNPDGIHLSHNLLQIIILSGEKVIMEEIGGLKTIAYLQKHANGPDAVWALVSIRTPSKYSIIVSHEQYREMRLRLRVHLTPFTMQVSYNMIWAAVICMSLPLTRFKSALVSVIVFDLALASPIMDKDGDDVLERDCIEYGPFVLFLIVLGLMIVLRL